MLAIAEWGARQDAAALAVLGFLGGRTPCQSTLPAPLPPARRSRPGGGPGGGRKASRQGVAVDGKAQRGRPRFPDGGCPVHALGAFCLDPGVVLAHKPIATPAGADKGAAEPTVAPAPLDRVDWRGRVLTGDALFCLRALCRQVLGAGGDDLVLVKENQGARCRDIRVLFDPPTAAAAPPPADRRAARTGHGRRLGIRELVASTDLVGYLARPGHAQVFRLERTRRERGQPKRARHHGLTSRSPGDADPARLFALRWGHRAIENRLHRRRDVILGEDASLIRAGQGPTVMARRRAAAVSVLHRAGVHRVAARLRRQSQHPEEVVALATRPLPPDA